MLIRERQESLCIHRDIQVKPVIIPMYSEQYEKMSKREKKVYTTQNQLFGRDLVTPLKHILIESLEQAARIFLNNSKIFKDRSRRLKKGQDLQEYIEESMVQN